MPKTGSGPFGPSLRRRIYYWKSDRPAALNDSLRPRPERREMPRMLQVELQRVFPARQIILEPAGTEGNHITYYARISGLNGFVRIEDGPEAGDCLELESRILEILRDSNIPVPEVYAVDSTRSRVPFAWQVLERIEDPDLMRLHKEGRLELPKCAFRIGQNVARWQAITPRGFGPFDSPPGRNENSLTGFHATYADYFFLHLHRHVAYLQEHQFFNDAQAGEVLKAIEAHRPCLDLEASCLVHKDLALWNILGTSDRISAFIDWEDAIGGDPMDDLSLLGCFYPGPVVCQALKGYGTIRPLPDNYRQRFWLHLLRNMLVKAVIRIGAGYFRRTGNLFLLDAGVTGTQLKVFTGRRIDDALRGLNEERDIRDL